MAWKYGSDVFLVEGKLPSGEMRNFAVRLLTNHEPHKGILVVDDTITHEVFTFNVKIPEWRKLLEAEKKTPRAPIAGDVWTPLDH